MKPKDRQAMASKKNLISKVGARLNIPSPISHVIHEVRFLSQNGKPSHANKVSVLDIGYGLGNHWAGAKLDHVLRGQIEITAFDSLIPSMPEQVHSPIKEYIQGLAPQDLAKIPSGCFDIVIAFDVIEHLSKEEGYLLAYEMERISGSSCIVFTPNGHVWQPGTLDNPRQAHISGWRPKEFARLGWKSIRGSTGLKFFFGPYAQLKLSDPLGIIRIASVLVSRLVLFVPGLAFSFVAVSRKKIKREQGN